MNNLKEYIIEKFKISKDIKQVDNTEFSKGDLLLQVKYFIDTKNKSALNTISLEIVLFIDNDNEHLTIKSYHQGEVVTPRVFTNSNGFLEYIYHNTSKSGGIYKIIFMDKETALEFVEELQNQTGRSVREFLKKYYDKDKDAEDIFSSDAVLMTSIKMIKNDLS